MAVNVIVIVIATVILIGKRGRAGRWWAFTITISITFTIRIRVAFPFTSAATITGAITITSVVGPGAA